MGLIQTENFMCVTSYNYKRDEEKIGHVLPLTVTVWLLWRQNTDLTQGCGGRATEGEASLSPHLPSLGAPHAASPPTPHRCPCSTTPTLPAAIDFLLDRCAGWEVQKEQKRKNRKFARNMKLASLSKLRNSASVIQQHGSPAYLPHL